MDSGKFKLPVTQLRTILFAITRKIVNSDLTTDEMLALAREAIGIAQVLDKADRRKKAKRRKKRDIVELPGIGSYRG